MPTSQPVTLETAPDKVCVYLYYSLVYPLVIQQVLKDSNVTYSLLASISHLVTTV